MGTEITYFVQILQDKALLIAEEDYEETTVFASGDNDSLTYRLVEKIDLPTYEKVALNDDRWKNARKVDENHQFVEVVPGGWDNYQYQHEGCGKTTKRTNIDFTKL